MAFDLKDFTLNFGAQFSAVRFHWFELPVSLNFLVRNTENKAYKAFGIGTEFGIYPGFFTDKLTVAAEAIWDAEWATYSTFSDYYKEVIYQNDVEGWYGNTGHLSRFGARIGDLINDCVEVYAKGGFVRFDKSSCCSYRSAINSKREHHVQKHEMGAHTMGRF